MNVVRCDADGCDAQADAPSAGLSRLPLWSSFWGQHEGHMKHLCPEHSGKRVEAKRKKTRRRVKTKDEGKGLF